MSIHYHKYENATLTDKRLRGTNRDIYDFMLALSHIHNCDLVISISEIAEHLSLSYETTRIHLKQLINMGFIQRIIRKDDIRKKWNLKNRYIVCDIPSAPHPDAVEYINQGYLPKNFRVPTQDFRGRKDKREIRENLKETLRREADKVTENSENSPAINNQEQEPDLSSVPEILQPVAKYLLKETGRSQLYDTELPILSGVLYHQHTPTRIIKEIDKFIEYFNNIDRPLHNLTFNYIGTCLSNQVSLIGKKKTTKKIPAKQHTQIDIPQIKEQILPVQEAKKIISEYTPAMKEQSQIPVALEELYRKMETRQAELMKEYADTLPSNDEGLPDWDKAELDEHGLPKLPEVSLEEYLRLKFPEAEEEELRTDKVDDKRGLQQALEIDRTCASCDSPEGCPLKRKGGRPAVYIKNHRLFVGYTLRTPCKHEKSKPDLEFENRLKHSGFSASQVKQTFSSYEHNGMPEEIVSAKAAAILAAKKHTSLIIAGKAGTGKTHLASAIALEAMREGKQAIFRTVPDLLEELKQAAWEHKDFFGLRQKFRDVPCLVLDDLGKEKTTDKGLEYLYQIIDYRYKHGKQTIVTTNALDIGGLMNQWNADKIEPLVSRILDNGHWVTIRNAENHRMKSREEVSGHENQQRTERQVEVKSSAYYDEELWKEDDDEYRLNGDKEIDYDDPAMAIE